MIRVISKALVDGTATAFPIWLISQIGLLITFATYQLCGQFLYPIFYVLAVWPNALVSLFLPKQLPINYYQVAYPVNCVISLIGWLLLSNTLSLIWYVRTFLRDQYVIKL